jgi:hypothetical protein
MKISDGLAAMRRPMSTRFRVRWSTAVMAILFLGLGELYLQVKTTPTSSAAINKTLNQVRNGLQPGETLNLYGPGATTTSTTTVVGGPSRPAKTSTTTTSPTSTTAPAPPTTELRNSPPTSTSLPAIGAVPTTTFPVAGSTSTSSTSRP